MPAIARTRSSCSECSTPWPDAPARPSLAGGCVECRREYGRRYNRHVDYPKHKEERRASSKVHYEKTKQTALDKHLRRVLAKHGLSMDDYERMLVEQDGKCAICGEVESGRFNRLAIDHCHATGTVRGLLCGRCNKAVGLLRDDPAIVRSTLHYLTEERV